MEKGIGGGGRRGGEAPAELQTDSRMLRSTERIRMKWQILLSGAGLLHIYFRAIIFLFFHAIARINLLPYD
jgi:hypothetical protein